MAEASFQQNSFLGGAWSKAAQGRIDRPDYRTALNVCLNSFPLETGAWTRRPGTRNLGTTRSGKAARVVSFDFRTISPYTGELSDGFLRFRAGTEFVTANDANNVVSISTANPARVTTQTPHGWSSNDQVFFVGFATGIPLLQARQFTIFVTGASTFTIADAVTGVAIDGAALGVFSAGTVKRVRDIATPYTGGTWATLRMVQTDLPDRSGAPKVGAVLLHADVKPYLLTVETLPTAASFATFSLAAASMKDGPYFDPVAGGALATPTAKIGVITVTISFNAYDATKAYAAGDYVTYSAVNYKSLADANVNHQPDISATYWVAVSAGDAVGPNGFVTSDIGRHIRLFSEPAIWDSAATYAAGAVVAYGGAGPRYDGATYWKSLVGANTNNTPGVDLTKWALFPTGAIWSWGVIRALSNAVASATGAALGDMTSGGGLAAAFDGIFSQGASASALRVSGAVVNLGATSLTSYVGKNYSAASDQAVSQVTIYPSSDQGFGFWSISHPGLTITSIRLNLYGKATAPATSADGTLLGTSGDIANTTAPVTILSNDATTAWKYLWVELIVSADVEGGFIPAGPTLDNAIAEVSFVNPSGSGTATGVSVEVRGDALLYSGTSIRTWRLGLYCDTVGWPTCGTYAEGRLFLSGVVPNRWDASVSNDPFNFAPTQPSGAVAGNNAISYTFNSPDIETIYWMVPDLQGVICGTQGGEWLIQATSNNLPLTPITVQAHRVTRNKCANIEPRRTGLTLTVVQAFRRKLLEYFADVFSGKFAAHNLTLNSAHLTKGFIAEIAYQHELAPVLWARRDDGALLGFTYKRESLVSSQPPDFVAAHPHTLGSGRTIESLCVGANAAGTLDALTMVTNDAATGIRHVEVLTDILEEGDAAAQGWWLDNAVLPTSTREVAATLAMPYGGRLLNGLAHLNGSTATVFASGLDCGDFAVADGSITVPYGDSISAGTGSGLFTAAFATTARIVVGFTYNSDGQIVRPASPQETGARTGPALGKKRRIDQYGILVDNTAGLSIGTDFGNLKPVAFKSARGVAQGVLATFSGVYSDTLADDYGFDSMICWRVSRPYPATIASVAGKHLKTQD